MRLLAEKGMLDPSTYFPDGTKIEANANRYTFVRGRAAAGQRARPRAKVRAHLEEVDRICEAEESLAALPPEETGRTESDDAEGVAERILERLGGTPKPEPLKGAGRLTGRDHLPRPRGHGSRVAGIGDGRKSPSKTDPDAMKEDRTGNGQLKAGHNVQVGPRTRLSRTRPRARGPATPRAR